MGSEGNSKDILEILQETRLVKGAHVVLEEERSRHNCRKLGMRVAGELLLPLAPACTMHLLAPACTSTAPCLHCLFLAPAQL